jgi:hypothetical protein
MQMMMKEPYLPIPSDKNSMLLILINNEREKTLENIILENKALSRNLGEKEEASFRVRINFI